MTVVSAHFPVLTTARLHLRVPAQADITACTRFWASDRSHMMGGLWTAHRTAAEFQGLPDQSAKYGFSLFTVTLADTDDGIGPFFPDTHPEPEPGQSLRDAADEAQGHAHEAATAARDWFFAATPHRTAVSHTDPANHRLHRLCERIGAVVDRHAAHPCGDAPSQTFRHHAVTA